MPIKNPDGSIRVCINYRTLNQYTVPDACTLPKIDEIIDSLANAKIFSCLDALSGYYQIGMASRDREKTAFAWNNELFEFTRMPVGLSNAPATFQRAMDRIFQGMKGKFVLPYLDDIIIYSSSKEEHSKHLE